MNKRLYIGNVSYSTDEEQLRLLFENDGRQVTAVKMVMNRDTGRPRGFAFVEMATDEDAKSAIAALDGVEIGGRKLIVNEAQERPAGIGSRGGPGGDRSYGGGGKSGGARRF